MSQRDTVYNFSAEYKVLQHELYDQITKLTSRQYLRPIVRITSCTIIALEQQDKRVILCAWSVKSVILTHSSSSTTHEFLFGALAELVDNARYENIDRFLKCLFKQVHRKRPFALSFK